MKAEVDIDQMMVLGSHDTRIVRHKKIRDNEAIQGPQEYVASSRVKHLVLSLPVVASWEATLANPLPHPLKERVDSTNGCTHA